MIMHNFAYMSYIVILKVSDTHRLPLTVIHLQHWHLVAWVDSRPVDRRFMVSSHPVILFTTSVLEARSWIGNGCI